MRALLAAVDITDKVSEMLTKGTKQYLTRVSSCLLTVGEDPIWAAVADTLPAPSARGEQDTAAQVKRRTIKCSFQNTATVTA